MHFVCVCLSHNSVVICMFLTFSIISFRARRRWHSANAVAEKQPKSLKNDAKIHQNSSKIHPKSTRMVPKSAPKAILEGGRIQTALRGYRLMLFLWVFGTSWAILGAIWASAGRQGDPKIEHFGTRKHQKSEK